MFTIKAIVLAGGTAERLMPITDKIPKPLIEIAGRPMIDYIMEGLERSGITDICVSTNERFASNFQKWLAESGFSAKIMVENMPNGRKLGAIAGLAFVLEKTGIDDDCMIIAGDNLFGFSLHDFIDFYNNKKVPVVGVHALEDREAAKSFGVVTINSENKITEFQEKPMNPKSNLIATACYLFPKNALKMILRYLEEGNSKDSPGYFLEWLSKKTEVQAFVFTDYWFDVGTHESLKAAREFMGRKHGSR